MLKSMSKADPEVAEYPFTTRMPLPGMARWENVQTQLIDMPPITPENAQSWMWAMLRLSDGLLLVFDVGDDDVLEQAENLIEMCIRDRASVGYFTLVAKSQYMAPIPRSL